MKEEKIRILLENAIRQAVSDGFTVFLSGMARGVDIIAAEIVLKMKKEYPFLKLVAASPYQGFEEKWASGWKNRYRSVLERADEIHFVSEWKGKETFQIRNIWMVDRSQLVIAIYNGEAGGTRNTIWYAMMKGVLVWNIFEKEKF